MKTREGVGIGQLGVVILALTATSVAQAQSVEQFYRKVDLSLVVASGVGGGYDTYSRALARHISRHLPGGPNVIVRNMPGAAGLTATNWLYSIAPRDGSHMLATYSALFDANLVGNERAKFDVRKFNWVGSIANSPLICVTWHTSRYSDIRQMIGQPVTAGATGRTAKSATTPLLFNEVLGTQFKVIMGYTTEGNTLALERGEVDAVCGIGLYTLRASHPDWFTQKKVNIVAQTGLSAVEELKGVPNVLDLVSAGDRSILEYGAMLEEMGRPYVAPPDVPAERIAALRDGFNRTVVDPAFLAEMQKMGMNVAPITGEGMEGYIAKLYAYPPEVVRRVAAMYGAAK
jgi:tripartite-type tricarboxylate transporter receptor subunit TctC